MELRYACIQRQSAGHDSSQIKTVIQYTQITHNADVSYIYMQLNQKQELIAKFNKLPPQIQTFVKIQTQNIREEDQNGQLQRIFMAYAVYVSSLAYTNKYPFTIMITASHNPPNYNGIKLQSLGPSETIDFQEMQSIINDQNKLISFIQRSTFNESNKSIDFFVGRDTRPTSSRLSEILIDTLKIMGSKVVDLGQGSTPQIFSLSKYLVQKAASNDLQTLKPLQLQYFQEIKQTFHKAVQLISSRIDKQWKKRRIYMDFSNGVGAISFKKYQFLNDFFEINIANNLNFAKPNVQCGAQWIYHRRLNLPDFSSFPLADFYVWFDGDSDRVIMKNSKQNALIQGEDFNACFISWLKSLISDLDCKLSLGSVGSILTNFGLIKYCDLLKIQYKQASVGISNLYKIAQNWDICSFFQPNGHGCVYFSQIAIKTLEKLKQKHQQAQLLLLIHNLSKNNSRGYALHVFLMLMLYFHYNQTQNAFLFEKTYSVQKKYHLDKPAIFVNSTQGEKLLVSPQSLVENIQQIYKKYSELTIKIRKSQNSPTLRVIVQGQQKICRQCVFALQQIISKYV